MATVNEKAARIAKSGKASIEIWTSKPRIINQQNFVSSPSMPSWLTLSRLSNGSYFNNAGLLVNAANDVARFDYGFNGSSWANQGLLLEKQKTNFIPRQYTFENMSSAGPATTTVLTETLGDLAWRRIVGSRVDNDLDRVLENSGGLVANTGTDLYISAILRKGTSGRGSLGFTLADASNNTIYPKLRVGFESDDVLSGSGIYAAVATAKKFLGANIWRYGIKIDMSTNPSNVSMRPWVGPYIAAANQYIDALVWQSEVGYPSSFIFSSSFGTITRAQDNLQLNISNYTGSVKLTYKRQDTDATESAWIDLTNATNPILTNSLSVGIWLQNIAVYNRTLTAQEKANA
ncbi:hypothetical protein [Acinetobacter soli]|uniref:hypothetical protein n=1 Tax=Acinetobacter soli TaxID=487316 RepID=UPI002B30D604|nr:hypothetical protein R3L12_03615 [Acinetobacter soli]